MQSIEINNQVYQQDCEVVITEGSGEDASKFTLTGYTPEDGSKRVYLHDDGGTFRLYRLMDEDDHPEKFSIEESLEITDLTGKADFTGSQGKKMFWAGLPQALSQAPGPFAGTYSIMGAGKKLFYNTTLVKEDEGVFYSPSCPASEMKRRQLAAVRLPAGLNAVNYALVCGVISALGYGWLTGANWPIRSFWWLGALAGFLFMVSSREASLFVFYRMIGAGFLTHFATHGLDYWYAQDVSETEAVSFESAHAALILVALLIFRLISNKPYYIYSGGALYGGGCAWCCFLCFGIIALFCEAEHILGWFSYYAGMLPFSLIWPVFIAVSVFSHRDDFAQAPETRRGLARHLSRLKEGLEQSLADLQNSSERLKSLADDLEDSVQISGDPAVARLLRLGPDFLTIRDALGVLESDLSVSGLSPDEVEHLEADLATLAQDLDELLQSLGGDDAQIPSLRVSPWLRCYGK